MSKMKKGVAILFQYEFANLFQEFKSTFIMIILFKLTLIMKILYIGFQMFSIKTYLFLLDS